MLYMKVTSRMFYSCLTIFWAIILDFRGTEGNNTNTSRMSEFGVLEQYLGFRIGDGANVNRSMYFKD